MAVEQVFKKYFVFGKTDCGKSRDHNEDNILINSNAALVMIADGMGGHQFGDKASFEAVNLINALIEKYLPVVQKKQSLFSWSKIFRFFFKYSDSVSGFKDSVHIIEDILIEANNSLYRYNRSEQFVDGRGMGTTIVGCKMIEHPAKFLVFHVGDSRLYRLRDNRLVKLQKTIPPTSFGWIMAR